MGAEVFGAGTGVLCIFGVGLAETVHSEKSCTGLSFRAEVGKPSTCEPQLGLVIEADWDEVIADSLLLELS